MGARREEALGLRQPQATTMMRCRNMTSEMLAAYSRVKPSGGSHANFLVPPATRALRVAPGRCTYRVGGTLRNHGAAAGG